MERYSSYKDSNVSWIGMIPEHWGSKQLRSFLTLFTEKGHGEAQLLSVTREQGVIERDIEDKEENHNFVPEDLSGYKYIEKGDFTINKMKAWQGSMAISDYDGIVSPAYHVCTIIDPEIDLKYLHHLLRNQLYLPEYKRLSTGMRIGQWDLGFDDFVNLPFVLPPLDEQKAIVEYIDSKVVAVDSLVIDKERFLSELESYKKSLIYECVTGKREVI
jgi:type I restriction enzyme S subunit